MATFEQLECWQKAESSYRKLLEVRKTSSEQLETMKTVLPSEIVNDWDTSTGNDGAIQNYARDYSDSLSEQSVQEWTMRGIENALNGYTQCFQRLIRQETQRIHDRDAALQIMQLPSNGKFTKGIQKWYRNDDWETCHVEKDNMMKKFIEDIRNEQYSDINGIMTDARALSLMTGIARTQWYA